MNNQRVLIVGAGIAGLCLARALISRGVRCDFAVREGGEGPDVGLYLPPSAVRSLTQSGVRSRLEPFALPITRQRLLDQSGRDLAASSAPRGRAEDGRGLAVRASSLKAVLRDALGAAGGRLRTAVLDVDQYGTVRFADGATEQYGLVVGADGLGSVVRKRLFAPAPPRYSRRIGWHFLADDPDPASRQRAWTFMLDGRHRLFSVLPLPDGRVSCYAEFNGIPARPPVGDWRAGFRAFAGPVPALLAQGEQAVCDRPQVVTGTDWIRRRAVLIGDAAHGTAPHTVFGAALAMEDALVLAELLPKAVARGIADPARVAVRDDPIAAALFAYQVVRAERVGPMLARSRRMEEVCRVPSLPRGLLFQLARTGFFAAAGPGAGGSSTTSG